MIAIYNVIIIGAITVIGTAIIEKHYYLIKTTSFF